MVVVLSLKITLKTRYRSRKQYFFTVCFGGFDRFWGLIRFIGWFFDVLRVFVGCFVDKMN